MRIFCRVLSKVKPLFIQRITISTRDTISRTSPPSVKLVEEMQAAAKPWESSAILPKTVRPESYHLFLNPDINAGTFSGRVSIAVDVSAPRDHLIVHTKLLNISSAEVINIGSGEKIGISDSFEYPENEFWVIRLDKMIQSGSYNICLEFSGSLLEKIVGFYRSSYKAPDNSTRHIVTTKFEPTYARRAFPCMDEPEYKAKYHVELVRPSEGYIALSNMNQINEQADYPSSGLTTVTFAPTPPMSTYLACFIICDFEPLEPAQTTDTGVILNVYARPGQSQNMRYARDIGAMAVNHYTKYFDIDYPLPKLDLIAIPDFVSGAMENWGLVTFRESSVVIDEEESSFHDYWIVTSTVCHEIAHMWFGDIVTMKWWDDLWLNEGFASFMEVKAGMVLMPVYKFDVLKVIYGMNHVLKEDAALSSHPIIQSVSHPDQITEIFDLISYQKGSSVLRMLEHQDSKGFRSGLTAYLNRYKFGSAATDDLWDSLQGSIQKFDVSKLMGTWTKQAGYPVVDIKRTESGLELTQRRYLLEINSTYDPNLSPYKYKWDIPLTYTTSADPMKVESKIFDMDKESEKIELPNCEWYKFNWRQVGYYRVNYPQDDWDKLTNLLYTNHRGLKWVEERCNLLEDAFSLASSGYLPYSVPLGMARYLAREEDFAPWSVAGDHLVLIQKLLRSTSIEDKFKDYLKSIVEPLLDPSLWNITNNTPHEEAFRRAMILRVGCSLGIESALHEASVQLDKFLANPSVKPNKEIRAIVYKFGLRGDKEAERWEKLWQVYLQETAPQELNKLRAALAYASLPEKLTKLLELAKKEAYIRSQDYMSVLILMGKQPEGNKAVWNFVRNEWEYLIGRFTLNNRHLGRVIPEITDTFATKEQLNEVTDFFAKYPAAGAGAAGRKSSLEKIKTNIIWREKYLNDIEHFLASYSKVTIR